MVDKIRRRSQGDDFEMTAGEFNAFADAAEMVLPDSTRKRKFRMFVGADMVCHEQTAPHTILAMDSGKYLGNADALVTDPAYLTAALDANAHTGKFAIAEDEGRDVNSIATGIASGLSTCRLFVPTNGGWINYADIDPADKTRLIATPNGSAQIMAREAGTNVEVNATVRLSNRGPRLLIGRLANDGNADAQPDSLDNKVNIFTNINGTDTVPQNTNYQVTDVALDWMANDEQISHDKQVLLCWFPEENRWRIIGAECEAALTPAVGQLGDTGLGTLQALTTTPAPWNPFDASEDLATPNVTVNAATATITIPANPTQQEVYRYNYSGTITPGSNNNTYAVDFTVNGVASPAILIDGRQSGTSLTFAAGGFVVIPISASPTAIQARISHATGSDTINWNLATFTLERNLDFA